MASTDPAIDVIDVFTTAMLEWFDPEQDVPPLGGGSTDVKFFAGDGALPSWSPGNGKCDPFLWVRLARRYRSESFPDQARHANMCGLPVAIVVEVGVGRCTSLSVKPNWPQIAKEAEYSLDDSWRIENVLCMASTRLRQNLSKLVALDTIAPYGPEGGIVAWTGLAYVQL